VVRVSRVRCVYEGEFFPAEDFEETADYGMVHERNLEPGTPRHTKSGRLIYDDPADEPRWIGPGGPDS